MLPMSENEDRENQNECISWILPLFHIYPFLYGGLQLWIAKGTESECFDHQELNVKKSQVTITLTN